MCIDEVREDHWRTQQAQLDKTFARCNVDSVAVATNEDYVQALLRLFGKRK